VGLTDDDDAWGRPEQFPTKPPEPQRAPRAPRRPRNHPLGLSTLAAAIATLSFELRLFTPNLSSIQSEITWLPVALIMTVSLCIVAGAWRARTYGVIGGILVLLPALYLFGLAVAANIRNAS
jgi:hypothetical protein